jgi:hypothetical protein
LNEKYTAETERLMENKNGHKTDDSIDKGDDKNKEANSEMQIISDQQPTTSTSIAKPEENVGKIMVVIIILLKIILNFLFY